MECYNLPLLSFCRTLVTKFIVKTEAPANLDLQTKDIAVCVRSALPRLVVN